MAKVDIIKHGDHKFMFINNDLWMWDSPRERKLQKNLANQAFGNVLVAGYGFGLVSRFLLKNPKVKSVTTVEKYPEIVKMAKKDGKIFGEVIVKDFYRLLEQNKYDCIVGDIWQDIDYTFLKDYLRFKNKARKLLRKNGKILAWGQDFFEYCYKKK